MRYQAGGMPLILLAGKEYGTGSSRDWAAKGPALLVVRAVVAESFARIHRSNRIGMGILPLQFVAAEPAATLGLSWHSVFDIAGLTGAVMSRFATGKQLKVRATRPDGGLLEFTVQVRIDTPQELLYYQHGGILPYVLRQLPAPAGAHDPRHNGEPFPMPRGGVPLPPPLPGQGRSIRSGVGAGG